MNTNVNRSGADASPRCSEGYCDVPMRYRDVPRRIKVCRGCLMDMSGCKFIGRLWGQMVMAIGDVGRSVVCIAQFGM